MAFENILLNLKVISKENEFLDLCIAANKDINLRKKLLENHELNRIMTHLGDSDRLSECRNVMPLLLIITLINNSQEAQNRMKECGYLTQLITMLCVSLEENQTSQLDVKTEYIIHAVAACFRRPLHHDNQTSSGRAIPKIISYFKMVLELGQIPDQMFLWSLLKCLIEGNKENQKLFVESKGLMVCFSAMKTVLERKNETGNSVKMLLKCVKILLILKSEKSLHREAEGFKLVILFSGLLSLKNEKLKAKTISLMNHLIEKPSTSIELKTKNAFRRIKPENKSEINLRKINKLDLDANSHRLQIRRKGKILSEKIRQIYKSPKLPLLSNIVETPKTLVKKCFSFVFPQNENLDISDIINRAHKEAVGFEK